MNPPSVEEVRMGALSGVVIAPAPPPDPTSTGPRQKRLLDQVVVSTYVSPLERVPPLTNTAASDLENVLKIVRRWSPLNQEKPPVMRMHDLYSNYFQMPVTAHSEQYYILLLVYFDKEDFQCVVDDGMLICNHNFN